MKRKRRVKRRNGTVARYSCGFVHMRTRCCSCCCCSRFSDITHAYAWRAVRTVMPIACPIAPTAEVSPYYSAVRHIRDDRRPCWCTKPVYLRLRSPLTRDRQRSDDRKLFLSFIYNWSRIYEPSATIWVPIIAYMSCIHRVFLLDVMP